MRSLQSPVRRSAVGRVLPWLATALALLVALPALAADPAGLAPHFDAEAASEAWLATLTPEARARSDAYFEGGYWLLLWDFLVGLAVAGLLLGGGRSARLRALAGRISHRPWLQTGLYAALYFLVSALLTLPWAGYEGWFREQQYGLSNQDLAGWLGDQAKGLLLSLLLGVPAVVAVYAVIRRAPRTWWLWGSLLSLAFLVFVAVIGPNLLEPVFNKFYPLPDSALKQQILALARANGVPAAEVWEFDASKQTTKMSAHVSGLLGTARISLNDNLMSRAGPAEVKAVLGHEIGHYVMNHVYKSLVFTGLIIVVGFALLAWAFDRIDQRYAARWGIRGVGDVAGLPLLVALFSIYGFLLTPLQNTLTRTMEAEADAYGLNAAREPDGFAQAALHLSEYRKMRPGPIEEWLFYDHPSGWTRIHRAMVWKAEQAGLAGLPEPVPMTPEAGEAGK